MTQSKNYNLKVFCDLKNIDKDSEEAAAFFSKKFYEQLVIIKEIKSNLKNTEEDEVSEESFYIIDKIRNNV